MPEEKYQIHAIIGHGEHPRVLTNNGALPTITLDDDDTPDVLQAFRALLGLRLFLRLAHEPVETTDGDRAIYDSVSVLDNLDEPCTLPEGARWMGREKVLALSMPEHHRAALEAYFDELNGESIPKERAAWSLPGWFDDASAWFDAQLSALGIERLGDIEQRRMWALTCVLRAPTSRGDVYMKAVPPYFRQEPAITKALAETYPEHLPEVLAIDEAERWTLMLDFRAKRLNDVQDAPREAVFRRYAQIQIEQSKHVEKWLKLGVLDRRLDVLERQIDTLPQIARELAPNRLSEDEIAALQSFVPRLRGLCGLLPQYSVPYTLVHGDFHGNNIAVDGERFLYFDWTDACVAHPFIDLFTYVGEEEAYHEAGHGEPLRAAYLEEWNRYLPSAMRESAARLAKPLAAAHMSISYATIVRGIEPGQRRMMQGGLAFWLRKLLAESASLFSELDA